MSFLDFMAKPGFKRIAKQRMEELFTLADSIFGEDIVLANRYVHLARKMAMRYKLRIPRNLKRKFCKHCYVYLRAGVNSRIRVQNGKIIIFCNKCKKFTRIPLK